MTPSSLLARARILALLLPVFALFSTAQVACGGKILDDFGATDDDLYGAPKYGGSKGYGYGKPGYGRPPYGRYGYGYGGYGYGGYGSGGYGYGGYGPGHGG